MALINKNLTGKLKSMGSFEAEPCMNCGTCTAVCPVGIEIIPRKLFRYVSFGMEQDVHKNENAIFSCLLCKMCEEKCPAQVHIAENIRLLRVYLNKEIYKT